MPTSYKDAAARLGLTVRGYRDAQTRFGVAVQPTYAPTLLTPADSAVANAIGALAFTWTYNDPDGGTQYAYAFRRTKLSTGVQTWWRASDSTWQSVETWNISSTQSVTISGGGWLPYTSGEYFLWAVATQTSATHASSAYASRTLRVTDAFAPLITAPATNLTTQSRTLSWTVADQVKYRARLLTGGGFTTVLADTGIVTNALTRSVVLAGAATGSTVRFELTVWNTHDLALSATTDKTVTYTGPTTPTGVGSGLANPSRAQIVITNPAGGDTFSSNSMLRSDDGGTTYAIVRTGLAEDVTFTDYAVQSGSTYSYKIRAYGTGDTFTDSAVI